MEVGMQEREYQRRSINELREAVRQKQRPVLNLPTGAGKTLIASQIFSLARAKHKRVAFCVPALSLINQTYDAFLKTGLDMREIGIIQGCNQLTDWARPVQICSLDTLVRRPVLPEADIVVFDEVHRNSRVYKRWIEERTETVFIGLSATPWRKGMGDLWDKLIVAETTRNLIDQGYLSPYRFFAPATPDLRGIKVVAGDYHEGELANAMNKPTLVADVVTTWLEKAERRPTFVFGVNCAHAQALRDQFVAAGVQAGYIDAYTPVEERETLLEQLKDGRLEVICNVGTMTTGVDAPFVSCIVLARPTRSEMLYIQIVGRGLRKCDGKKDLLILDHAGDWKLGFPDDIVYEDFVDGHTPRKCDRAEPMPKPCPKCAFLITPGEPVCPSCGFVKRPISRLECEDGELVEVNPRSKVFQKPRRDEKQVWYSSLLWIAKDRGYKEGWAANKYKLKFGVWPRGLETIATYPTQNVFKFLKEEARKWWAMQDKSGGAFYRNNMGV
jgi:superfamily II DNA or RNA helicase